jgi:hypothetical protein
MAASPTSPGQVSGFITVLYLFDVAQGIDVPGVSRAIGVEAAPARLTDKTPGPPRATYAQPPAIADGSTFDCAEVAGFRVRVKLFDFGVISLMLTQRFSGSWADLVSAGQLLIENEPLEERATAACRQIVERLAGAMTGLRRTYLSEDYLVFAVTETTEAATADELLESRGDDIAQLLRGERMPLSRDERRAVLGHRLSYLADDLVVAAWNAAFIRDNEGGALAAIEILEFANSQLLELRYHDDALEGELDRLYAELQRTKGVSRFGGRRRLRAVFEVQSIVIEVNELTDRMENALKFVGDPYAARLFGIAADRLGLARWKASVNDKLRMLEDIRRFAVEQAGMAQANVLELAIVLILVLELGLFFAGIME